MNIDFEWDEYKNQTNIEKHGIDFSDAIAVFNGPIIERTDDRIDYGETRYILLGQFGENIIAIVYTKRNSQFRLISARQANKNERKAYKKYIEN